MRKNSEQCDKSWRDFRSFMAYFLNSPSSAHSENSAEFDIFVTIHKITSIIQLSKTFGYSTTQGKTESFDFGGHFQENNLPARKKKIPRVYVYGFKNLVKTT